MFCIKPFDKEIVIEKAKTGRIVVAQDHNVIGGLGSMISLFLMENNISCKYKVLGCPDYFVSVATADYLYRKFEYDTEGLKKNMKAMF